MRNGLETGWDYVTETTFDASICLSTYGTHAPDGTNVRATIWNITSPSSYDRYRIQSLNNSGYNLYLVWEWILEILESPITNSSGNAGKYITSATNTGAFTFYTNTQTATIAPSSITINLAMEDTTATMNSHLNLYVSRDEGTTYSKVTMIYKRDYSTGIELYSGTVDVSEQPSGTSIKVKVESAEGHEVKLHGLSVS